MRKAADDPAVERRMWRMLWESELYTFIPDHPEMRGEFTFQGALLGNDGSGWFLGAHLPGGGGLQTGYVNLHGN